MQLFWFFVDEVGWPMMQYKVSLTDVLWNLKDGPTIQLWEKDATRWAKLLAGVPNPIPFCPIWGDDELKASE
jgi:hypothetical protein